FPGEATVRGVVFGEMRDRGQIGRFIDGDNLHVLAVRAFVQCAQDTTADATIAVDREPQHQASSNSLTVSTTASVVKPKCSINCAIGADSPKVSMPMMAPSRPTYLYQKSLCAASIATRANTSLGNTVSRYIASC